MTKKPRHRSTAEVPDVRHSEPCHISSLELSAVAKTNKTQARQCFEADVARFPEKVGLTSKWEIVDDGAGQTHAARGQLHLLDYKRSAEAREQNKVELPGTAAMSCAASAIRTWQFPAYSPKDGARMRMKCWFNFVIKEPRSELCER